MILSGRFSCAQGLGTCPSCLPTGSTAATRGRTVQSPSAPRRSGIRPGSVSFASKPSSRSAPRTRTYETSRSPESQSSRRWASMPASLVRSGAVPRQIESASRRKCFLGCRATLRLSQCVPRASHGPPSLQAVSAMSALDDLHVTVRAVLKNLGVTRHEHVSRRTRRGDDDAIGGIDWR